MNCSPCRWIICAIRRHSMISVPMPSRFMGMRNAECGIRSCVAPKYDTKFGTGAIGARRGRRLAHSAFRLPISAFSKLHHPLARCGWQDHDLAVSHAAGACRIDDLADDFAGAMVVHPKSDFPLG